MNYWHKNKLLKLGYFIVFAVLFILGGCHSGISNSKPATTNVSSIFAQKHKKLKTADMDVAWSVDEDDLEDALNFALRDMGWHVITMKVKRIGESTPTTKVGDLLSIIYPKPSPNVGQEIEMKDINCKAAVFAKVGDSCSSYFRLKYDLSKGTDKIIFFPVQIGTKGDIPAFLSFTAQVEPSISIVNFRFALRAESQYYSAANVAKQKDRYHILVVQNGSLFPINLTALKQPTNPLFSVLHRTTNDDEDPYYGSNAECNLTPNLTLKQTNQLVKLFDSCIVIYQAATSSTVPKVVDTIELASDARYFYPPWNNKFKITANYTNAYPETAQTIYGNQMTIVSGNAHPVGSAMVMDSAGSLEYTATTKNPINAVTIDDYIKPVAPAGSAAVLGQTGDKLYYDPYASQAALPSNFPLLVATSNGVLQTTVIEIGEVTPDNQVYTANIDGACPIQANIKVEKEKLYYQGKLIAVIKYAYNGLTQTFDDLILATGSSNLVYQEKRASTWTNVLNGKYDQWDCKTTGMYPEYCLIFSNSGRFYNLGEANPRKCDQAIKLRIPTPDYHNYQKLSTPIPQTIAYIGNGGQSYLAAIGNVAPSGYNPAYQVSGAASNGALISSYRLTATPAQQVKFKVNLNAGDIFYQASLTFARSDGYDLVNFNEEVNYPERTNHE